VDEDGGGQPGTELFACYDMGAAHLLSNSVRNATWGFRFGLQYYRADINNNNTLSTGLTTTTHSFDINANDTAVTLSFDSAYVISLGCVYTF
jgi:hypothetical protein